MKTLYASVDLARETLKIRRTVDVYKFLHTMASIDEYIDSTSYSATDKESLKQIVGTFMEEWENGDGTDRLIVGTESFDEVFDDVFVKELSDFNVTLGLKAIPLFGSEDFEQEDEKYGNEIEKLKLAVKEWVQ